MSGRIVRAIYRACEVPDADAPYDRLQVKIYYPAVSDDSDEERNMGVVPADEEGAPFPVIVILPGYNLSLIHI